MILAVGEVWEATIQGGFAAFSVLLLGYSIWLVWHIVRLSRGAQQVIESNTAAISRQTAMLSALLEDVGRTRHDMERLRYIMEARPCLLGAADAKEVSPKDDRTPR